MAFPGYNEPGMDTAVIRKKKMFVLFVLVVKKLGKSHVAIGS